MKPSLSTTVSLIGSGSPIRKHKNIKMISRLELRPEGQGHIKSQSQTNFLAKMGYPLLLPFKKNESKLQPERVTKPNT